MVRRFLRVLSTFFFVVLLLEGIVDLDATLLGFAFLELVFALSFGLGERSYHALCHDRLRGPWHRLLILVSRRWTFAL